jgi:hypothetical protein
MISSEWDKLPVVKREYYPKAGGRIALDVYPNKGSLISYAESVYQEWVKDREAVLRSKDLQEDMVGLLLAIATAYMDHKYYLPARLKDNNPDDAIDRMVIGAMTEKSMPNDTEGTAFQIVCTIGEDLDLDRSVNGAILRKVAHKHKKGQAYADGLQLAIFVAQSDWKVDTNQLIADLKKIEMFSGYWLVLPLNDNKFIVDYLRRDGGMQGQGQMIIDISNGIKARHMGLYEKDGKLDDVIDFLNHFNSQNK